jgi:predicted GIY-YIG superfamily endonuclease
MSFWAYMLHCKGGYFYTGHTDDLEHRMAQHASGEIPGFVRDHWPAQLVWSSEFPTRYEALVAERQIKGWSRAKKLALIRDDWDAIRIASRKPPEEGQGFDKLSPNGEGMVVRLIPHPDSPPHTVDKVAVSLVRGAERWQLAYHVTGGPMRLPDPAATERTDGLWQTTCFELFVRTGGETYCEFNFAPSTQWAAYRFDAHRAGMRDLVLATPVITRKDDGIDVVINLLWLGDRELHIGLSAIIEEKDGTKSYWALKHPPGAPDFHHPDCFALQLPVT